MAERLIKKANRWRDQYNPLRGLTIARAVTLIEQADRGELTEPQWAYQKIERGNPTLKALKARRRAALEKLDWDIKVVAELPEGATAEQAEDQRRTLRAAYDAIDNIKAAIRHLALAEFRGFSIAQIHENADGDPIHIETLPHWNFVRDGRYGQFAWNPESRNVTFAALEAAAIAPDGFLIREVDDPLDELALVNYVRKSLVEKDWDAFIEIYGIPQATVVGPPDVPEEKEAEYQTQAENIANGGSGYLPHGSEVLYPHEARSNSPFEPRVKYLDEQLVLAGTGGKLTMLAESGSGTLAGSAHQEAWEEIGQAEAMEISESFQTGLDSRLLAMAHPGEPILAYFAIAAQQTDDKTQVLEDAGLAKQAGFEMDEKEVSERTGYKLTKRELPPMGAGFPSQQPELRNRANVRRIVAGLKDDLQPVLSDLRNIMQISDAKKQRDELARFRKTLPQRLKEINQDPMLARLLEQEMQVP